MNNIPIHIKNLNIEIFAKIVNSVAQKYDCRVEYDADANRLRFIGDQECCRYITDKTLARILGDKGIERVQSSSILPPCNYH